ncbi:suppressor protein SRP40 isoform X4 [Ananas comosus]|uniref:Suppressor protein SRP40 isoform X4 n=1 Tax=Ananas comosus TaxID=4615 RepID=A0A6P5GA46_ANACO|nr:suppressor protein SRP40 isoform X4 [Ananas comosus]
MEERGTLRTISSSSSSPEPSPSAPSSYISSASSSGEEARSERKRSENPSAMDPKATAKSKRIHSQHGRRNHPTPSSIAQRKKPSSSTPGAAEEKPRRPRAAPALPSNWDRYDADADAEDGGGGGGGAEGAAVADKSSEVAPKSKGADFGYLIEEARSQPQEIRGVVGLGFSSEELPFDLMQGRSSILSVKGEGLLSWCQDDNFIVDDDTSSGYELTDGSKDYEKPPQSETSIASEIKHGFSQPVFQRNAESEKDLSSMNYANNPNTDNEPSGIPSKEKSQLLTTSGSTEAIGLILPSSEDRVPEKEQNRPSAFEAAAAEAELDMLLNSFSETSLSSSFADIPIEETSTSSSMKVNSSYDMIPPSTHQRTSNSRLTAMSSLDDALDGLLAETSLSSTNIPSHSSLEPNIINDSTSNKPKNGTSPFDDSLDDLLAETSLGLKDQKYTVPSHDQGKVSSVNHSSSSLLTRPADDIDSWLDSL